jgi:disulfide bond formation protein DsbB
MYNTLETTNTILALGSIVAQVLFVLILLSLSIKSLSGIKTFVEKKGVFLAFLTMLFATTGSLFYSNVIGFEPCVLCWFQRIFIFSQVVLLLTALITKLDKKFVGKIMLPLSVVGGIFSVYHFYIKMTGNSPLPCAAFSTGNTDCAKQLVLEFGYINIPMMALSAFLLTGVIYVVLKKANSFPQTN